MKRMYLLLSGLLILITGMAPAVGHSVTVTAGKNPDTGPGPRANWHSMAGRQVVR